eukprot:359673-Chlamydomonas_euryale.AAC.1
MDLPEYSARNRMVDRMVAFSMHSQLNQLQFHPSIAKEKGGGFAQLAASRLSRHMGQKGENEGKENGRNFLERNFLEYGAGGRIRRES